MIERFPQDVAAKFTAADGLPSSDVSAIHCDSQGNVRAKTDKGWAVLRDERWSPADPPANRRDPLNAAESLEGVVVNQTARSAGGTVVAATGDGLMQLGNDGFGPLVVYDGLGRRWGARDVRGVAFDSRDRLWFATLAGVACRTDDGWKFYTGADGLPYNDFTSIAAGPDGEVWFGTHLGAVRFRDGRWAYRQGPRWLPNDDVRDVAVDGAGNAWFATAGGVGVIKRRMMTLAEKAQVYEEELERYIRRTPYGYTSEVRLAEPGDKSSAISRHDSDNDGLWTAMYGAGECFAYAATGDPKAKERAKRAFEALRFLQKVTQGGEHSPPHGFVARTIRSTDLPDPNRGRLEHDRRFQQTRDSLWKVYEPRWPKSADAKWYWKSDTSSDELDGHYFFYPLYYDLVAEDEAERARVREVVRDLTDHLIEHGYNLVDHDGTPTRWGVFNPESLNRDPDWLAERGLNSLSMLSYLAVAQHMTGDAKYGEHIRRLCEEHYYDANAAIYKHHHGPGSGNHSDDEMAVMNFCNLMKYAQDDQLRRQILISFYRFYINEQPEMNPLFNFAYAAYGLDEAGRPVEHTDPWGAFSLGPWDGWLDDSVATLKGFPLDRLNWPSKNSHRLDVSRLSRQAGTRDISDGPSHGSGSINGKVVPVANRHFNHWNTNPWRLDYGGDGRTLASGTVFLLPYYMGLYHGFIDEADTQ